MGPTHFQKVIKNAEPGLHETIEFDGVTYEFRMLDYSAVGGYAPMIIIDGITKERYKSDGYLVLNGHTFVTTWEKEYADYRNNWIYGSNLIITID